MHDGAPELFVDSEGLNVQRTTAADDDAAILYDVDTPLNTVRTSRQTRGQTGAEWHVAVLSCGGRKAIRRLLHLRIDAEACRECRRVSVDRGARACLDDEDGWRIKCDVTSGQDLHRRDRLAGAVIELAVRVGCNRRCRFRVGLRIRGWLGSRVFIVAGAVGQETDIQFTAFRPELAQGSVGARVLQNGTANGDV